MTGAMPSASAAVAPGSIISNDVPRERRRHLHDQPGQREQFRDARQQGEARRPGEEECFADFAKRRGRQALHLAVRQSRSTKTRLLSTNGNTISVFDTSGKPPKWGDRQRRWRAPARPAGVEKTATSSSSTAVTTACRSSARTASSSVMRRDPAKARASSTSPGDHSIDKDISRRRLEQPPHSKVAPRRVSS